MKCDGRWGHYIYICDKVIFPTWSYSLHRHTLKKIHVMTSVCCPCSGPFNIMTPVCCLWTGPLNIMTPVCCPCTGPLNIMTPVCCLWTGSLNVMTPVWWPWIGSLTSWHPCGARGLDHLRHDTRVVSVDWTTVGWERIALASIQQITTDD